MKEKIADIITLEIEKASTPVNGVHCLQDMLWQEVGEKAAEKIMELRMKLMRDSLAEYLNITKIEAAEILKKM